MMPWQLARDLIRVREAELSRRARAAARRTRGHEDPADPDGASRPARTAEPPSSEPPSSMVPTTAEAPEAESRTIDQVGVSPSR